MPSTPMVTPEKRFGFLGFYRVEIYDDDSLWLQKGLSSIMYNLWDLQDYDPKIDSNGLLKEITPHTGKKVAQQIVDWVSTVYC